MNPSPIPSWDFGYYGIFICVFLEQIGVPIPAFPSLLAAGALVASGELSLPLCLATAVVAALTADIIWYSIGRVRGNAVLGLMCRLSWKPDSCVSKTKSLFAKQGTTTLLFSKFVPGLSTMAPPLAGIAQVPFGRFMFYDGAGTIVWALGPLLVGLYFVHSLASLQAGFDSFKGDLPWICGVLILAVLLWRYLNRRRYLISLERDLKSAISAHDLKQLLDQNQEVIIVDVRAPMDFKSKPIILPGALYIPYTELPGRLVDIPFSKRVVTYCDCPRDQAAVAIAVMLLKAGAKDARPLLGGLKGWVTHGFATSVYRPGLGDNPSFQVQ